MEKIGYPTPKGCSVCNNHYVGRVIGYYTYEVINLRLKL